MSRQHQIRTFSQKSATGKKQSRFAPPPVIQPKAAKKAKTELPEWKPGGSEVNPLTRLRQTVQAKLTIGQSNDKYEQDAVGGGEASSDLESSLNHAKSGGQSLDSGLQESMGQAMGADFSGVKIHTDSHSDQLNHSLQAKALTTENHIFFQQGEYNPATQEGQELIAHELTHTMQQGAVQKSPELAIDVEESSENGKIRRTLASKGIKDVTKYDDNFMTNLMVMSGHGVYCSKILEDSRVNEPNMIKVPGSTTVTMWLPHGSALNNWLGSQIELGNNFGNLVDFYQEKNLQLYVYEAGDKIYNYHLLPGKGLTIQNVGGAKSFTPDRPYTLQELLIKFRGRNVHWAACAEVINHLTFDGIYKGQYASKETEVDPKHLDKGQKLMSKKKMKHTIEITFGNDIMGEKWEQFIVKKYGIILKSGTKSEVKDLKSLKSKSEKELPYKEVEKIEEAKSMLSQRIERWFNLLTKLAKDDAELWQKENIPNMKVDKDRKQIYEKIKKAHTDWQEVREVEEVEKTWSAYHPEYRELAVDDLNKSRDILQTREEQWTKMMESLEYKQLFNDIKETKADWDYGGDRSDVWKKIEESNESNEKDKKLLKLAEKNWQKVDEGDRQALRKDMHNQKVKINWKRLYTGGMADGLFSWDDSEDESD